MRRSGNGTWDGMTLGQAALVAGIAYLTNPAMFAEGYLYPKLVRGYHVEQTAQHTLAHPHLFAAVLICYLLMFIGDVVTAWALYVLMAPVNRALSLLAAWLQLVYAAMGLTGLLNLATAYRMLNTPDYWTLFGQAGFEAQVELLLRSFRYDWELGLVIFGLHLIVLGALILRSTYVPRWLGAVLVLDGLAWVVDSLLPYLAPQAHLGWVQAFFAGELIFMVWLLGWGWRLSTDRAPQSLAVEVSSSNFAR